MTRAERWHRRGMGFVDKQGAAMAKADHYAKCVEYSMRRALAALQPGEKMKDRTRVP